MDSKPLSKDSMQSTWRTAPRSEWNISHYLLDALNAHPIDLNKAIPVHSKDEKIPYMPQWYLQRWVLFYSALPLLLHEAYMAYTGRTIGPITAFNFYFIAFNATVIYQVHILRRLGHKYGFLDGDKHARDGVPDVGVAKIVASLYKTTGSRMILSILLSYNKTQRPSQMSWIWLPLEIGVYGIVLDFWFYWYHRLMAKNSTDSIIKTCGTTTYESTPKRPLAETAAPDPKRLAQSPAPSAIPSPPSHRTTTWVSSTTDVSRLIGGFLSHINKP
ncbi:hypothetical protein N7449_009342 [Penicillium cf. viridicatum]|uniref:Uncharacterized protein n=1 Tax=Penicillium cf. viridicatum TaxID=2972119 RepID=A0A9W9JDZ2_9EURO|nr:hypothetical protein N7449_009342 [Penicillium cf. viridicatum]